jgi:organizing structure protein 2
LQSLTAADRIRLLQLSIYPGPAPKVVLIEDPNPLVPHVKVVRETASDILGDAKVQVDRGVDKWVKFERRVERKSFRLRSGINQSTDLLYSPLACVTGEVKSVLPKDESLTPGILYVGVAGLAGSVLARNRKLNNRKCLITIIRMTSFRSNRQYPAQAYSPSSHVCRRFPILPSQNFRQCTTVPI